MMIRIDLEDYVSHARSIEGLTLSTLSEGQPFHIEVPDDGRSVICIPKSGNRYRCREQEIQEVLSEYAKTGSLRPGDYNDLSRRSSYLIAVLSGCVHALSGESLPPSEQRLVNAIRNDPKLGETERRQLIKARIGQGQFRTELLAHWGTCCLTGCSLTSVLKASHIKPWSDSSNRERLDKYNGLLLSPNADALFDRGLISFSADGELLIAPVLSPAQLSQMIGDRRSGIAVRPEHEAYLKYHREHRFRGDPDRP